MTDTTSGEPLQVITVPSVHKTLQEQLRRYIAVSGLKPGDRLPSEAVLARKTGASRNAVREALRGLEALGLVEARQGSGWYVRRLDLKRVVGGISYSLVVDAQSLDELLEVRAALEEAFLPRAVAALSAEDLQGLRAAVEAMRVRASAGEAFAEEDMEFHRRLFCPCGNEVLMSLLEMFWRLFLSALDGAMLRAEDPARTIQLHEGICNAIERGDVGEARELLRQQFEDVRRRLGKERAADVRPGER